MKSIITLKQNRIIQGHDLAWQFTKCDENCENMKIHFDIFSQFAPHTYSSFYINFVYFFTQSATLPPHFLTQEFQWVSEWIYEESSRKVRWTRWPQHEASVILFRYYDVLPLYSLSASVCPHLTAKTFNTISPYSHFHRNHTHKVCPSFSCVIVWMWNKSAKNTNTFLQWSSTSCFLQLILTPCNQT